MSRSQSANPPMFKNPDLVKDELSEEPKAKVAKGCTETLETKSQKN